jgi:hypothetical protein
MDSTIPTAMAERVDRFDASLFDAIDSETSLDDRTSLLALQSAMARGFSSYSYLEIGSHLGGSIQPHLLDSRCRKIYSIDPRPARQPDNRGIVYDYPENSTQRMLANLRALDGDLSKIQCFDSDARQLDPSQIADRPHFCFIDGEHTTTAAVSDFQFCRGICHPDAVIAFHDASIIVLALKQILKQLRRQRVEFRAGKLPGEVFFIAFGRSPVSLDAHICEITRPAARFLVLGPLLRTAPGNLMLRGWRRIKTGLRAKA